MTEDLSLEQLDHIIASRVLEARCRDHHLWMLDSALMSVKRYSLSAKEEQLLEKLFDAAQKFFNNAEKETTAYGRETKEYCKQADSLRVPINQNPASVERKLRKLEAQQDKDTPA